jgi:zinc protease
LTGFDAANALAIAAHREPLTIHKVASGTEIALQCCTEGLWYDELVKNKLVQKKRDATAKQLRGPDDTTAALVDTLNQYQADLFVTSGHATQGDWMIGFRYRNGFFRSKAGQMFGVDTNKTRIDIHSTNPKVYLPIGNCLMGNINGPDAMALAWMNDVGVKQMIGYTVPTWYGYQGWGILDYFIEQPGRYTMNQAFFANHHALVHRLGESSTSASDKRGLKFDRDVVAFYGDPAWSAKMAEGQNSFEQTMNRGRNSMTFTITPNQGEASFDTVNNNGSQRGGRPFVGFFDQRIKNIKITRGHELHPIVTDNFVLLPRPLKCDPTQEYKVTFTFELID